MGSYGIDAMNATYLIAIIIVITILLVLSVWRNTLTDEQYMYGFWVAEGDDFCESSEISSMMIFIGEPVIHYCPPAVTRACYIVIMNGMCSQGFTLRYRPGWTGLDVGKYVVVAGVTFDDEDIWPHVVNVSVDMSNGVLKIWADDTIYARLNKQHDTTNVARLLADSCPVSE